MTIFSMWKAPHERVCLVDRVRRSIRQIHNQVTDRHAERTPIAEVFRDIPLAFAYDEKSLLCAGPAEMLQKVLADGLWVESCSFRSFLESNRKELLAAGKRTQACPSASSRY
jgi:hypothetical protein